MSSPSSLPDDQPTVGKLASPGGREQRRDRPGPTSEPILGSINSVNQNLPRTRVRIRNREIVAEIDSCASENFVRYDILREEERKTLQPGPNYTLLAARGLTMRLRGRISLSPRLGDREYPGIFVASEEMRVDLTLGRTWLKDHDIHHEHRTDILYLGTTERKRIFLVPVPSLPEIQLGTLDFNFMPTIPPEHAECLRKILHPYASVFHQGGQLRETLAVQHDIQLSNRRPFREAPRRYSELKKKFIDEQRCEMLADGIIETTTSPWISAIMITTKQQDAYRFCIDFLRFNEKTVDAPQCLPRIHEILKDLGKSKILTTLDLKSRYWQIPLMPEARKYTAFLSPDGGQYQFRVMPFGLKNALGTFQNPMRHVMAGYWGDSSIAYLDDIIIYSDTWEDHPRHIALVLERLHAPGLTCSLQKCQFGQSSLPYLGHVVTSDGNHPQPRHV